MKNENSSLIEQINNFKLIVSDMNAKIKDLNNKKNSGLITVIKILQEDQHN